MQVWWLLSYITILVSCSYRTLTAGLYRGHVCVDIMGLAAASISAWESSSWQKGLKSVFDKIRWIKTIQSFAHILKTFNIRLKKRWHLCQPLGGSHIRNPLSWRPICWHPNQIFIPASFCFCLQRECTNPAMKISRSIFWAQKKPTEWILSYLKEYFV